MTRHFLAFSLSGHLKTLGESCILEAGRMGTADGAIAEAG